MSKTEIITKESEEKTTTKVKDSTKSAKPKATKTVADATTPTKKSTSKKIDAAFYVQYQGKEFSKQIILEKIHEEWLKSHKLSELKTLSIYLKVEDDTAYCLINGEININLKLS